MAKNEQLTQQAITNLWFSAVPLSTAWYFLAPESRFTKTAFPILIDLASPAKLAVDCEEIAKELFLAELQSGEIAAIGLVECENEAEPLHHAYRAAFIPNHAAISSNIDWLSSRIRDGMVEYIKVRIAVCSQSQASFDDKSTLIPNAGLRSKSDQHINRKPGPEPGGDELRRIYKMLQDTNIIQKKHTVKAAWAEVVKYIEAHPTEHFERGRGLSYPTFAREISKKTRV